MNEVDPQGEAVQIKLVWRTDDRPIVFANHFALQHSEGEFILTVGQLQPPVILGTPQERLEQARELSFVPINVVGRFSLTRARVEALAKVLTDHLAQVDQEETGRGSP